MHRLRSNQNRSAGFTLIELIVVIVILGILLTLVGLTYNGVQAKNRNNQRQTDINSLQTQLETYYAQSASGEYPSLTQINSASWRAQNLPKLKDSLIGDPSWNNKNTHCTSSNAPTLSSAPTADCYAYQVTAASGSACDNVTVACAHYTLTATLEGAQPKYVKGSLN